MSHDRSEKKHSNTTTPATQEGQRLSDTSSGVVNSDAIQPLFKHLNNGMITPNFILQMQRAIGNRATQELISMARSSSNKATSPVKFSHADTSIQRSFDWTEDTIEGYSINDQPVNTGGTFEPYRNMIAAVRRYKATDPYEGVPTLLDIVAHSKEHIKRHSNESRTVVVKLVMADAQRELQHITLELLNSLDTQIGTTYNKILAAAKLAEEGSSEAQNLDIYLDESVKRIHSLREKGELNQNNVKKGRQREVILKPIFITTTKYPREISNSIWHTQFEDCKRVWTGLGVMFTEEQSQVIHLDDTTEAGHLISYNGLPLGKQVQMAKGDAIDRLNKLLEPHKPGGKIVPIFILPSRLPAENTDGITLDARTIFITGNRISDNVLAHEVGHVLGIDHPKYEDDDFHTHTGEKGSVADPSGGHGFTSAIGHSSKTNPASHYDLMERWENEDKPTKIKNLIQELELDQNSLAIKLTALKRTAQPDNPGNSNNPSNPSTTKKFSDLTWSTPEATEQAQAMYTKWFEGSQKLKRLKTGIVYPAELGGNFPKQVTVTNKDTVIFGHD